MAPNDPTSDLEAERAVFTDCKTALDALSGAFARAIERPGGLSAAELVHLRGLSRRTFILLASVAFPVPGTLEDRNGR